MSEAGAAEILPRTDSTTRAMTAAAQATQAVAKAAKAAKAAAKAAKAAKAVKAKARAVSEVGATEILPRTESAAKAMHAAPRLRRRLPRLQRQRLQGLP